jgi:hypothetical protein
MLLLALIGNGFNKVQWRFAMCLAERLIRANVA